MSVAEKESPGNVQMHLKDRRGAPGDGAAVTNVSGSANTVNRAPLMGAIDPPIDIGYVTGWAVNNLNPASDVRVYALIHGRVVGSALAKVFRSDLEAKKIKRGLAGFEIRFEFDDPGMLLLRPGVKLTVAFDPAGRQPLTRGIVALEEAPLKALLRDAKFSIGENPFQQFEQSVFAQAQPRLLARMAITMVTRLWLSGNHSAVSDFVRQARQISGCRLGLAEMELLAFAVAYMRGDTGECDIGRVDGAGYERSKAIEGRKLNNLFSEVMINCLNGFALFLAGRASSRNGDSSVNHLLGEVARVYSLWTHRLYGATQLALQFLLLVEAHESPNKARYHELLAQQLRGLNRNEEALTHCLHAVRHGSDYWWAYHEASVLLKFFSQTSAPVMRENLPTVRTLAHEAFLRNPYQNMSVREFDGALDSYHGAAIAHSWQLATTGMLTEALRQRDKDLQAVADNLIFRYGTGFNTIGAGGAARSKPGVLGHKVLLLGSRNLFQCHYYRIQQKLDQLSELGVSSDYLDIDDLGSSDWIRMLADVAVLIACRVAATAPILRVLAYAKGLGIPIIYDVDDLIFDVDAFPPPLETYGGSIDAFVYLGLKMDNPYFRVAMKMADAHIVSTAALADEVLQVVGPDAPIGVLPNLLGREIHFVAQSSSKVVRPSKETVEVFYGSATKAHKQCFYDVFLPAALQLLERFPQMALTLVGHFDDAVVTINPRIKLLKPTPDFLGYVQLLRQADINIAVLEESRCTDVKSEIKWMEAAAFGIPSVVTPTRAYRDVLTDGEDVLFANSVEEWGSQLARLIEDISLRQTIGANAKQHAFAHFSPVTGQRLLHDLLSPWLPALKEPKKKKSPKQKKRILLANVYFHPQSIGGATRIIETQVRGLLEHHGDEYEVFVLTTDADPDGSRPYKIEQYWFGNALVTRINVSQKDWTEYRDPRIHAICLDFFKAYRFDLIHFHCIQIMTASPLEAAYQIGIPYVVTIHDAWWLSVHQFLVDKSDKLIDHTDPLGGIETDDQRASWIVRRRLDLKLLLGRAAAVVAVSEKFAQLYREAGIEQCGVHENISEPFDPLPRHSDTCDQITLGFIGGMSAHKGMPLLRQALEEGDFSDYRLIVIDHALQPGEQHSSRWGNTAVEFRPKVKQSEVAKLYAQLDVLVAPSIWPESFGLVTREAIQAGVWVIASDRGTIGDCIDEGVNGNRIRVDDASDLLAALRHLPQCIVQSKPRQSSLSMADADVQLAAHVAQQASLYSSIFSQNLTK